MKSPKVLLSPRGFLSPRAAVKSPEQQKREAALEALRSWAAKQKHDNYEALKVWDQKRAAWLAVHSRSLHQLKDSLQQRLENSHEFMQCVRQFLLGHCERMVLVNANCRNCTLLNHLKPHSRSTMKTANPRRSKSKLRRYLR